MHQAIWCEHLDKQSKFTVLDYRCREKQTFLRVQSWYCPECGVHGAETEIVDQPNSESAPRQKAQMA